MDLILICSHVRLIQSFIHNIIKQSILVFTCSLVKLTTISPNHFLSLDFSINFSLFSFNHSFVKYFTSKSTQRLLNSSSIYQGKHGTSSNKNVSTIFLRKTVGI